ncbi:S-layer homology domain-containing protein [Bacillus ndiopicus]|uniref:S-layer homology domain-containing protein n=1 Tax=Bacillus ndiopicus TaxID=1347368 RepID=UPI0005A80405|nr:S-layer homology domain-containing protein [Bacillus ndiopicus]
MGKSIVSLCIMLVVLFSFSGVVNAKYQYSDVNTSSSHYEGIEVLRENGLIGGYRGEKGGFLFKPNDYINRSEVAAIFYRVLGLPEQDNYEEIISEFKDLDVTNPLVIPLAATIENGIFTGENGYFNDSELNREQMATTIVRAFGFTSNSNNEVKLNLSNVSPSHQASVKILSQLGITTKVDDFRPKEKVTRAQFITFLYRAMKIGGVEQYIKYELPDIDIPIDKEKYQSVQILHDSIYIYANEISNGIAKNSGLQQKEVEMVASYAVAFPNTTIIYKNLKSIHVPQKDVLSFWIANDLTYLKKLKTFDYKSTDDIVLPQGKTLLEVENDQERKVNMLRKQNALSHVRGSHLLYREGYDRNVALKSMSTTLDMPYDELISIINYTIQTGDVYDGKYFITYFDFDLGTQWYITKD